MRAKGFKRARRRNSQRAKSINPLVTEAIADTVNEVHAAGRANIDAMVGRRTGKLRRFYTKVVNKAGTFGRVGYRTRRAQRDVFYARFVHDGTSKTRARPFHDNAVLEFTGRHARRMKLALSKALNGGR